MMNSIIDKMIEALTTEPNPVLPSTSLGAKRPTGSAEVPAVVMSLIIKDSKGIGIGRSIREGSSVAQHTGLVAVSSTNDAFSNDLLRLNLWPLPLRKNPSSVTKDFETADIQIRNVTDLANPTDYLMMDEPTQPQEFRIDATRAQIIFGQPQSEGDSLEVVHWTVTWRDDIRAVRYKGSLEMEILGSNSIETTQISQRLQDKLSNNLTNLRQRGFLNLQPAALGPVEVVSLDSSTGSSFVAWKQQMDFRFVFEIEDGGELSGGGQIRRIDVDIDDGLGESMSIPNVSE